MPHRRWLPGDTSVSMENMDRGLAWMQRMRGCHDLLRQGLAKMWSAKEVEDAAVIVEQAADTMNLSSAVIAAAKAGNNRSRCFCCVENGLPKELVAISRGSVRVLFRRVPGKIEVSLHLQCIKNKNVLEFCRREHMVNSDSYIRNADLSEFSPAAQEAIIDAGQVFAAASSGPLAGSSG